jgi:membrane protease YdiL (CAAX protease family)
MNIQTIFINSAGRLRSGWRVLVFLLVYVLIAFLIGGAIRLAYAFLITARPHVVLGEFFQNMVFRGLSVGVALVAGYICAKLLEGLPWHSLGLWFHQSWFRDLVVGSVIGFSSLAVATGIATIGRGLTFTTSSRAELTGVIETLLLSGVLFVVAALAEEALFRGYPLQTFTRARLVWLAVFLTSVPFAAVHLRNPNVAAGFTFVNTALAGVWLAVAYLRTRSLWFPLGVHWSWNWALGSVFGLPVSGINNLAPHPLFHGADLGPAWLTGGAYGIEGGIACTATLLLSTAFIWRTRLVKPTEEMLRLTSRENPAKHAVVNNSLPPPVLSAERTNG